MADPEVGGVLARRSGSGASATVESSLAHQVGGGLAGRSGFGASATVESSLAHQVGGGLAGQAGYGVGPGAGGDAPVLEARWLGRRDFNEVLEMQLALREAVIAGATPTMLLVEHPPVLTLGRRAAPGDILWTDEQLAAAGMTVIEAPRGGQVTLHAPGQLVAYPVVPVGRRIREHIVRLGETARALLGELGVAGCEFRMDHPGVWLGDRKLASIGVHLSRGVTVQGLALNLDVDPALFGALVSCGLRGVEVTSARVVGGAAISVEAAARRYAALFAASSGHALRWAE